MEVGENGPAGAVCRHVAAARVLHQAGVAVVVIGPDSTGLGRVAAELRAEGPGRIAVFVGDPDDPADRDQAAVMAEEQFGVVPVWVTSPAQARALLASRPN